MCLRTEKKSILNSLKEAGIYLWAIFNCLIKFFYIMTFVRLFYWNFLQYDVFPYNFCTLIFKKCHVWISRSPSYSPRRTAWFLFICYSFSLSHLTLGKRNKKLWQNKNLLLRFLGACTGLNRASAAFQLIRLLGYGQFEMWMVKVHYNLFVSKRVCISVELVKLNCQTQSKCSMTLFWWFL